jgi:glucokinase
LKEHESGSLAVGVDVGGTKIKTALVDRRGNVVDSQRQSTDPEGGPDPVIREIVATVKKLVSRVQGPVTTFGLGIAGQINSSEGVLLASPNLGWHDVKLKAPFEDALDMNVFVTNDVAAAAWGEWRYGAGRGESDLICVFVGTGVGAGVITEGRLLRSSLGSASELGHVPLVFEGRKCSCRHRGCLEAYVGGWAIAERAREMVEKDAGAGQKLLSLAGETGEITARHVTEAFRQDDPLARRIIEETGRYLSAAAVGMVNAFHPSLLVFGGGVIEAVPELTGTVEKVVRDHALGPFVTHLEVTHALLGEDAGIVGAAAMARAQAGETH